MSARDKMVTRLLENLTSSMVKTCSTWAKTYRYLGGELWTFDDFPWLEAMHNTPYEYNVGQKSAQVGFSETLINLAFFKMDVKKESCQYVLPKLKPYAAIFSSARFDVALEDSPHLRNMFTDCKNVTHKRAGPANLYVTGSESKTGLKSNPVSNIFLDEVDEMNQDNITLALKRSTGQDNVLVYMVSTPSIEGFGINKHFNDSNQQHYFFRCPSCKKLIELTFPESIVMIGEHQADIKIEESHLICTECKARLPEGKEKALMLQNGLWVPKLKDRTIGGWHVNQLYSCKHGARPASQVGFYLKAQGDPYAEQEFFNSNMGLTRTVEGSQLTHVEIERCIKDHKNGMPSSGTNLVTMGIDTGKTFYVTIDEWFVPRGTPIQDIGKVAKKKLIHLETFYVGDAEQRLMELFDNYSVNYAVIDANPERNVALNFCKSKYGHVSLCIYGNGRQRTINKSETSELENMIVAARTPWMDLALNRYRDKTVLLPSDTPLMFKEHLRASIRVYRKGRDGFEESVYVNTKADHFAHAHTYSEIAFPFAYIPVEHESLRGVL